MDNNEEKGMYGNINNVSIRKTMKEKKKVNLSLILVLVAIVIVCVFVVRRLVLSCLSDEKSTNVSFLENDVDFILLNYGEPVIYPDGLTYTNTNTLEVSEEISKYDYVYLIINDHDSSIKLTEDEIRILCEVADKNMNFIYIGTNYLKTFEKYLPNKGIDENDMSIGYIVYEGSRLMSLGVWTKDYDHVLETNKGALGESICISISSNIRSNK